MCFVFQDLQGITVLLYYWSQTLDSITISKELEYPLTWQQHFTPHKQIVLVWSGPGLKYTLLSGGACAKSNRPEGINLEVNGPPAVCHTEEGVAPRMEVRRRARTETRTGSLYRALWLSTDWIYCCFLSLMDHMIRPVLTHSTFKHSFSCW